MALLYADENFPLPVVLQLRRLGHDVLTIHEDGRDNQRTPDATVLQIATGYKRAVLTINRKDFFALHEQSTAHAGIIACTYDSDTFGQAQRIDAAVRSLPSLDGKVTRVNRPQR
jgi:hypothetical protein